MIKLDQFVAFAVDEFDREVAYLAQEDVTDAVEGGYESATTFEFVHFVGLDGCAAAFAVNTAVYCGFVADDAVFGRGDSWLGWSWFAGFGGYGYHLGLRLRMDYKRGRPLRRPG